MSRSPGTRISTKERVLFAAALRALWIGDPTTTLLEACTKTGAPRAVAQQVRQRLIYAGVVRPNASEVAQAAGS
jgi:hypothetical protein